VGIITQSLVQKTLGLKRIGGGVSPGQEEKSRDGRGEKTSFTAKSASASRPYKRERGVVYPSKFRLGVVSAGGARKKRIGVPPKWLRRGVKKSEWSGKNKRGKIGIGLGVPMRTSKKLISQ